MSEPEPRRGVTSLGCARGYPQGSMSVETRLTTKGSNIGPFHRAHIMEEMHAGSVAELVRWPDSSASRRRAERDLS